MGRMQDLTGQQFGRLTVIDRGEDWVSKNGKRREIRWNCLCKCGNTALVRTSNLKSGISNSCGCYNLECISKRSLHDLTGKKYGKLTVIDRTQRRDSVEWNCLCECGKITQVSSCHLVTGHTKSCGCLRSSGEYYTQQFLTDCDIDYIQNKKFEELKGVNGCNLSYDFYLPEYNILIECQGGQHYKPINLFGGEKQFDVQQEHDKRKREYAKANGYDLIEISYKDYNRIDEILAKELNVKELEVV